MHQNTTDFGFEDYRNMIDQISPCMNDYLYVYDIEKDLYYIAEKAMERFSISEPFFSNVLERHKEFVHPEDLGELTEDLNLMISGTKKSHNLRYRWIGKDGKYIWINCRGYIVKYENDKPAIMIGCINEIGKKRGADNISGLLGEFSFFEYINSFEKIPDGFVLRIGIDDFKKINEKFGITMGDQVLHDVADCIMQCLDSNQSAYRIVADEFEIVDFSENCRLENIKQLYRDIRTNVDCILEQQQYNILYTISAGIIDTRELKEKNFNELQKLSQFALSKAKENGKNQFYCFNNEDYEEFLHNREVMLKLRKAISNGFTGFSLNYQPIVHSDSGKLLGAEALLRFQTEEGTSISPAEVIPVLEESGLIIPVGKWVIRTAAKACREFQKQQKDFKVSVNLSYVQLLKSAIFEEIMTALEVENLDPCSFVVELTESGKLEDNKSIKNVWTKLKSQGVQIAVDDFGSGYSNLKNIGNLQPNFIKIDREFTIKALQNEFDYILLGNIIQMAHSLKLKFVVEGIEKEDELQKIMGFCPEYIQGYYYGRPVPFGEFQKIHFCA